MPHRPPPIPGDPALTTKRRTETTDAEIPKTAPTRAKRAPAKPKSTAPKAAKPKTSKTSEPRKPVAATPAAADAPRVRKVRSAKVATAANPSQELIAAMVRMLDDDKAEDIQAIDLTGRSIIADAMIIASGRSQRHVIAMAEHLRDRLKADGLGTPQIAGMDQGDWVVLDAGDVVVHLFRPEVRAFYNLEGMWRDGLEAGRRAG